MFEWSIQIYGFENTLEGYSRYISDDEAHIIQEYDCNDHPHYYLTSIHFNNLANQQDVKNKSETIISFFSGAASLVEGDILCFRLSDNIIKNNFKNHYIDPQLKNFKIESSVNQLIKKAWVDSDLKNIINIIGESCQQKAGNISYDRLYFIYEILKKRWGKQELNQMEDDMGIRSFWSNFQHTAQDPKIIGIEARHGSFNRTSTSNPIDKEIARDKVMLACQRWINDNFEITMPIHDSFPRHRQDFSKYDYSQTNITKFE